MRISPLRYLSTLRHGRGFGVHSPLAFELISRVLPDRPAYYADSAIRTMFRGRRQRRIARIAVRLAARFEPRTMFVDPVFEEIMTLVDPRIIRVSSVEKAEMSVCKVNESTVINIGNNLNFNSVTLDNEKDLRIVVRLAGLSPTLVNTTL